MMVLGSVLTRRGSAMRLPSTPLVTPSLLEAFARKNGLQVIYRKEYESPRYPEMRLRKPLLAAMVDAAAKVMNFLLPGKTDVRHGDYHVILRKR